MQLTLETVTVSSLVPLLWEAKNQQRTFNVRYIV